MSGQSKSQLDQLVGWDESLSGSNCPDKTRKRLRSGKCYGFWSYPEEWRIPPICSSCGEVGHSAEGCKLGRVKVCQRCGEEGHYSNQCTTACANCDRDHLPGNCPTAKITCFLCEGNDHYPKDCSLNRVIVKLVELQQRILRASASLVTTDEAKQEKFMEGLSEELQDKLSVVDFPNFQTLVDKAIVAEHKVRALEESRKRKWEAQKSARANISRPRVGPAPVARSQAPPPLRLSAPVSRPPQAVFQPRARAAQQGGLRNIADVTCFFCNLKGHYANNCPKKLGAAIRPNGGRGQGSSHPPDQKGVQVTQSLGSDCVNHISAEEAQKAPDVMLGSDEFVDYKSDPLQQASDL